ncbi:unnamed protein product, partial [Chrysoparadoxa australica]
RGRKVHGDGREFGDQFILKRMLLERGQACAEAGAREIFYGEMLRGEERMARYVEHFYADKGGIISEGDTPVGGSELWLVFRDEGESLRQMLYTEVQSDDYVLSGPSALWRSMKLDPDGPEVMKDLVRQLLEGVRDLHSRGVLHRDIKPSNILVYPHASSDWAAGAEPVLKIGDFSSAVEDQALDAGLYGEYGPTQMESTMGYAPPEVLFDQQQPYPFDRPEAYDLWSVGVTILEMLLGTPDVFTVSQRTRAMIALSMHGKDEDSRSKAFLLAAMADFCITPDSLQHWPLGDKAVVMEHCGLEDFGKALHQRDPLDIGFHDPWGLDLLWRLLRWDPKQRISAEDALEHAYFAGSFISKRDASEHATFREARAHEGFRYGARLGRDLLAPEVGPGANLIALLLPNTRWPGSSWAGASKALMWAPTPKHMGLVSREGLKEGLTLDLQHSLTDMEFECPKCGRRNHPSHLLVSPSHPLIIPSIFVHSACSGWCDVQGRRRKIEDYHSIVFQEEYKFYGVFDGHRGSKAAKYASRALHTNLEILLDRATRGGMTMEEAVTQSFIKTHEDFLKLDEGTSEAAGGDESGTTATVVLVYPDELVVANVGDSRAVLCCSDQEEGSGAVALTVDHTPYIPAERARVEAVGGEVTMNGVLRVEGQLAVTRSLGNRPFTETGLLSSIPDVSIMRSLNAQPSNVPAMQFLIIASDGLWDVMTNDEAVARVQKHLLGLGVPRGTVPTLYSSLFDPSPSRRPASDEAPAAPAHPGGPIGYGPRLREDVPAGSHVTDARCLCQRLQRQHRGRAITPTR